MLAGADPALAVRLAGLTNVNFRIAVGGEEFVVRIPGDGTHEYIDRRAEEVAARAAADAGVNAEVLFFDPADGLMLARFVAGSVTMTPERFQDRDAVARAARTLRRLHDHARPFASDFRLFPALDDYRRILERKGAPMPDGWADAEPFVAATRAALERTRSRVRMVPSHCDPLSENFLDVSGAPRGSSGGSASGEAAPAGGRMYLVDFEYAGNNDPMWDLGDLSVEAGFDSARDEALLRAYFEGSGERATASDAGRMQAFKAMSDVLWALWGMVQHADGNPAEDFHSYANGRLARALALMRGADYERVLAAI